MTKTKTEQLNELFGEWEAANPDYHGKFICDGIINEDIYNRTNPKVLFIAKEANQDDAPEEGDFREWWANDIRHPFTYRLAEWAFGILNDFPPFEEIHFDYDIKWKEKYREAL